MSVNAAIRQLHLLASGGMAELYLAENGQGHRVVVKRIRPPYDRDPTFRALFQDEGKICGALDSPHIVRLLDEGEDESGPYLVFEYIEGTDLSHVMDAHFAEDKPLETAQVCAVIHPLLRALVSAHETHDENGVALGLVHRDISPGNVLLSNQGDVYLADFGVAFSHTKTEHTVAGELKGKFAYMSPEQTQAATVDARSDLFALGTLTWEMLTGTQLFDGPTDVDVAQAVRNHVPSSPADENPLIPPELSSWVEKLLAKAPDDRYPSARDALEALEAVLEGQCLETGLRRHVQMLARAHPRPAVGSEEGEEEHRRRTQRVFRPESSHENAAPRSSALRRAGAVFAALTTLALVWAIRDPADVPASGPPITSASITSAEPDKVATPALKKPAAGANAPAGTKVPVQPPARPLSTVAKSSSSESPKKREVSAQSKKPKPVARGGVKKVVKEKQQRRLPGTKRASPRSLPKLAAASKSASKKSNEGFGTLFLESEPWAYVSIDGAPLGSHTPLLGLRLPAGKHRVELKNPVLGLQKTMNITIRAGEEARHYLDLTSR